MIKLLGKLEGNFSVGRATIIIGSLTLLSRLMGLFRDQLFAAKFGASSQLDIYNAAFRFPDLLFNLFVLGTVSAAFVPVLSSLLTKDKVKAHHILSAILNIVFLGMAALSLIYIIFAPQITHLIVPGFDAAKQEQTVMLSRLLMVSQLIFAVSNVVTNGLISLKRFLLANFAPALYNFGIIISIVFFYDRFGLIGLGYGVLLGALMHLAIQLPELFRSGFRWRPQLMLRDPNLIRIGHLFWPRLLVIDSGYITLLIGTIIGSTLAEGSITVFNFASNLQAVPLGIFALSAAIAAFPALSEAFAQKESKQFVTVVGRTMVQILYFMIPFAVAMLLFRAHIVRLILGHGRFGWDATRLTFTILGVFCFGLISQALIPLFSRAFYALHNTKTPVVIGLIAAIVNGFLSYFLSLRYGIVGVAGGLAIASILQCIILMVILHMRTSKLSDGASFLNAVVAKRVTWILLGSCALGLASYGTLYAIEPILNTRTTLGILIQAGVAALVGALVYIGITKNAGLREASAISKWIPFM